MHEGSIDKQTPENSKLDLQGLLLDSASIIKLSGDHELSSKFENFTDESSENVDIQGLGEISPEAQQYILHLQSSISSAKRVCCSTKEFLFQWLKRIREWYRALKKNQRMVSQV